MARAAHYQSRTGDPETAAPAEAQTRVVVGHSGYIPREQHTMPARMTLARSGRARARAISPAAAPSRV